jgi:predicted short-subunit dehydrogenase-like oxidoreductase (DUF2520 family)
MDSDTLHIGIIGAGKVGCTLARLWAQAGYTVSAVYSRDPQRASALAHLVSALPVSTPQEVLLQSTLIVMPVTDDAIQLLASALATMDCEGKAIIHTSGVQSRRSLDLLAARGHMTGCLHPAFPFANVETAMRHLPGATFAIEASHPQLYQWLHGLVAALNGVELILTPEAKAAYHAALVIASNYTVTLYAAAERILTGLGAARETADNALNTLVMATVENLRHQGIPDALTGPLIRQDIGTLEAHIDALRDIDPQLLEVYRSLARLTYPLLEARGVSTGLIDDLMQKANHRETDDT